MNKNYPIYKTTFIDDMRSLVEEAAGNFSDSIAISYKENYWDKEVRKVTFSQWRDDVRNLGTALIAEGLREEKIAIVGENSYGWCCSFFAVMAIGSVTSLSIRNFLWKISMVSLLQLDARPWSSESLRKPR